MTKLIKKANVATAGFMFASQRAETVAVIKQAIAEGMEPKAIQLDFCAGHMAFALMPKDNLAKAIAACKGLIGALGAGAEAKEGKAQRTAEQETAYGAARTAWHRVAKEAGVVTKPRGKPGKKGKAKQVKSKQVEPKPGKVTMPKVKDANAANAQLLNMAKMASGFCAKNKDTVCAEASKAVADFVAAMSKLAK